MTDPDRFHVVIAGAGLAAIESALALRELAGARVDLTLAAPDTDFVHRPTATAESPSPRAPERLPLARIAEALGAAIVSARVAWVERVGRTVHMAGGPELPYDALILCVGAVARRRHEHALTIDDPGSDALEELDRDVERGEVRRVAFIVADQMAWPVPLYEAALRTAAHRHGADGAIQVMLFTSEAQPLQIFGETASRQVAELLVNNGVELLSGVHCEVPEPGRILVSPSQEPAARGAAGQAQPHTQSADRIITLPELHGPHIRGVPRSRNGFIPVNPQCRVRGVQRVYAAGDATDFPVKHAGIAAQQAEVAACAIAGLAGAPVPPRRFRAKLEETLLTGGEPLYLSAVLAGGHSFSSEVRAEPSGDGAAALAAARLRPYLERL